MNPELVSNSETVSTKSKGFDWRLICASVAVFALAGSFFYFWKITSKEVETLNFRIAALQLEREKLEKDLYKAQSKAERFRIMFNNTQAACRSVPLCNEEQARIWRRAVLGDAGLVNVVSQTRSEGIRYYEYLFERPDQTAAFLPQKLKQFMSANCLTDMRDVTTTVSNRYDSMLADGRVASIVMDGELRKITCAWVYNVSTDTYTPIKHADQT